MNDTLTKFKLKYFTFIDILYFTISNVFRFEYVF